MEDQLELLIHFLNPDLLHHGQVAALGQLKLGVFLIINLVLAAIPVLVVNANFVVRTVQLTIVPIRGDSSLMQVGS